MAEIKLKKRYPDIPEETVSEIFSRGYLAGWENALKRINKAEAIPVEWIEYYYKYRLMPRPVEWFEAIQIMVEDWEKENGRKKAD